jgi:uncharacterized protein
MYEKRLNDNLSILYSEIVNLRKTRFDYTKQYIQHGKTSVYKHSVSVAYASCVIAARLNLKVDVREMVRGALLHDYFLYDWHVKDKSHRLHGFTHPKKSLANAMTDFQLSSTEQDIIVKHMFPLTVVPPVHKEGWIVTFADKYCSLRETFA